MRAESTEVGQEFVVDGVGIILQRANDAMNAFDTHIVEQWAGAWMGRCGHT